MKRFFAKLFGPTGRRRATPLRLERLDERDVPATLVWVGSAGGSWSTAGNWSTGTAPVNGDQLDFGLLSGANTSSKDDITNLTVSEIDQANTFGGTIEIQTGKTLEVSTTFTNYGTVQVDQGAELKADTLVLYGTLNATGPGPSSNPMAPPNPTLDVTLLDMVTGSNLVTSVGTGSSGTNESIGTLTMATGTVWTVTGAIAYTGDVSSAGTINIGSGATAGALAVSGDFSMGGGSTGVLNLNNGTLTTPSASDVSLACTVNVATSGKIDAASVTFKTGAVNIGSNSSLQVTGNLDNQSSVITFADARGGLIVGGDFTEEAGATLSMKADNGVGASFVIISGTDDLGGTLLVSGAISSRPFTAVLFSGGGVPADFDSTSFVDGPLGQPVVNNYAVGGVYSLSW